MELYKRTAAIAQVAQTVQDAIGRNLIVHTVIGSIDAADQKRIFVAPATCIIRKIYLITETALAKNAAAYRHFRPVNVSVPNYLHDEVSVNTSTFYKAIAADTPYEILINENTKLAALNVIELYHEKTGAPGALSECSVVVIYSFCEDDEA